MDVEFEWDEDKAKHNVRKHRVKFEDGATIFHDPFIVTKLDSRHSDEEDRFISVGFSIRGQLLLVVHVERGERIRIISCRKATIAERKIYEKASE